MPGDLAANARFWPDRIVEADTDNCLKIAQDRKDVLRADFSDRWVASQ